MTKNILDTILDEEEPVIKSGFIVPKKNDPEIKIENIEDVKVSKADFSVAKIKELSTLEQPIPNTDLPPIKNSRIGKIYKKHKSTHTEKTRILAEEKNSKKKKKGDENKIEITLPLEPLWLSVSEAAKIGGVEQKTIRRAIQSEKVKFKIINDRYLIEFSSMVKYLYSNTKLRNKFLSFGVGQYVDRWI
jgi:DNA-binding transcriptional MerR regulator